MILEKASPSAIKYAVMNWHYSKSVPVVNLGYSVFTDDREFCGVICFGRGATNKIGSPYGLQSGQCIELIRVALNGRQQTTSKALSIAMRLVRRDVPLAKMLVSFADTEQDHLGIIYQATNWHYVGMSKAADEYIVNGRRMHGRSLRAKYGSHLNIDHEIVKGSVKHRYIYPLDKSLLSLCKKIAMPYPKSERS